MQAAHTVTKVESGRLVEQAKQPLIVGRLLTPTQMVQDFIDQGAHAIAIEVL